MNAANDNKRPPLTDAELERISELLLDKLVRRLANSAANAQESKPTAPDRPRPEDCRPRPEDFAYLEARRRRRGKE